MVDDVNKLIEIGEYKKAASTLSHRCKSIQQEAYYAKLSLNQVRDNVKSLFGDPESRV